jgi:hypothetical protein
MQAWSLVTARRLLEAGKRFFDMGTTAFKGPHREEMN